MGGKDLLSLVVVGVFLYSCLAEAPPDHHKTVEQENAATATPEIPAPRPRRPSTVFDRAESLSPVSLPAPAASNKLDVFREESYVDASALNLRAEPSIRSTILASLPRGTRVLVLESRGNWRRVRPKGLLEGWVSGRYLTGTESAAMRVPPQVVSTRGAPDRAAIAQKIIAQSINAYPGNCPCPESRDRSGRRCGKRSAYSRPGGAAPLCYITDVTDDMIARFR